MVCVPLCRLEVFVAHVPRNGVDVHAILCQPCPEGVTKVMKYKVGDFGLLTGFPEISLQIPGRYSLAASRSKYVVLSPLGDADHLAIGPALEDLQHRF